MIKKTYLSLIFITTALLFSALPVRALYWGVLPNYNINNTWKERYFAYKILKNIPIKYTIIKTEDNNIKDEALQNVNRRTLDDIKSLFEELNRISIAQAEEALFDKVVSTGFNTWLKDTKQMIINEGREDEFADIMPILSRNVSLEKISNTKEADINIIFANSALIKQICGKSALGCEQTILGQMIVPNKFSNEKDSIETQAITTHEIGHFCGLSDQYKDVYSRYVNTKNLNYTPYRIGNKDSLMAAEKNPNLACDDVDGFINLIDLTLYLINKQENTLFENEEEDIYWSKRAQKGWASFCNGKKNGRGGFFIEEFYKKAKLDHFELPKGAKDPFSSIYDMEKDYQEDSFFIIDEENKFLYSFDHIIEYGVINKEVSLMRLTDGLSLTLYKYEKRYDKNGYLIWKSKLSDDEHIKIIDKEKCIIDSSDSTIIFDFDENNKLKFKAEESSANLSEEEIHIARAKCDFMTWEPNIAR